MIEVLFIGFHKRYQKTPGDSSQDEELQLKTNLKYLKKPQKLNHKKKANKDETSGYEEIKIDTDATDDQTHKDPIKTKTNKDHTNNKTQKDPINTKTNKDRTNNQSHKDTKKDKTDAEDDQAETSHENIYINTKTNKDHTNNKTHNDTNKDKTNAEDDTSETGNENIPHDEQSITGNLKEVQKDVRDKKPKQIETGYQDEKEAGNKTEPKRKRRDAFLEKGKIKECGGSPNKSDKVEKCKEACESTAEDLLEKFNKGWITVNGKQYKLFKD